MPRVCSVCSHPNRDQIDTAVAANRGSIRGIARQHRVSPDALERHAARHLPQTLARAVEAREDARAEDLATKTRSELKGIPTVVVSTEGSQTRIERLQRLGVRFIHKPFTPEAIRDTLKEMLGSEVFHDRSR